MKYCHSKNKVHDGYKLMPNDIVKLGRVRFRVKEIVSPRYSKLKEQQARKQKVFKIESKTQKRVANKITLDQHYENASQRSKGKNLQKIMNHFEENQDQIHLDALEEIEFSQQEQNEKSNSVFVIKDQPSFDQTSEKGSNAPVCRICLSDESDQNNPLFSPCKCAGTMKYIHVDCLREWVNSKKVCKETEFSKTYFWKNLECELCMSQLPN